MGCVNSKKVKSTASPEPYYDHSVAATTDKASVIVEAASGAHSGILILENNGDEPKWEEGSREEINYKKNGSKGSGSQSLRLRHSQRLVEAEQNAAGWPHWLSAFAGEAIQGWVPLRADSYEKLDKIGQGTYSSVFRAREVETGKMVALKKVRFDNLQPESIRFMAREITILRRLDHPNIMKLEGIITSLLSSSIYLVFEYMEHDLAGLVSCPDIKFSEAQVKCYMRQLLSGLEHCHVHGIMHRDIKASNILVSNEGILKIADFGLANTLSPGNKQPLTSRVVTLWYRPPELLMGSTNYGVSVDLWSVGCVFAELYLGKPVLKGRNEVEQLHKIFKLCGSPPDEFWKKSKLPHVTMFKPHTNYDSTLRERCKDFPETAINLMETLLSIDPFKRGTASSALMSKYFSTKPYACDPSTLPKYPPNKEMDAKARDDVRWKKIMGKVREPAAPRQKKRAHKMSQEPNYKPALIEEMQNTVQKARKDDGNVHPTKGTGRAIYREPSKPSLDATSETSQNVTMPRGFTGPVPVPGSGGFTWAAKKKKPDASSILSDGSKSRVSAMDPSFAKGTYDLTKQHYNGGCLGDTNKHVQQKHRTQHLKSFDAADVYHPLDISFDFDPTEQLDALTYKQGHKRRNDFGSSGPLTSKSNKINELLEKNDNSSCQAVRRSRFGKGEARIVRVESCNEV